MIKQLAIWYLRKMKVQLIINIHFLNEANISGVKSKDFFIYDCDGENLTVHPNYKNGGNVK